MNVEPLPLSQDFFTSFGPFNIEAKSVEIFLRCGEKQQRILQPKIDIKKLE